MDWWYIIGSIFLGWTLPWAILQFSDAMFILDQIFRILYWGTVVISFEFTDWHWAFCMLSGLIPGSIIWSCYEQWYDEGDEFQTLDDEFEIGTPIEQLKQSDSLAVLPNQSILSPHLG